MSLCVLCHLFSWRELDSLSGVSRNQEGAYALSFNYNNIQHQPNGEGLDIEEEEVCIPLTRFLFLFLLRHMVFCLLIFSTIQCIGGGSLWRCVSEPPCSVWEQREESVGELGSQTSPGQVREICVWNSGICDGEHLNGCQNNVFQQQGSICN